MRVGTSYYGVVEATGDFFEVVRAQYLTEVGKELEKERLGWHWILHELDAPMPKNSSALLKSDACKYLAVGLSRGRYELRIHVKPEAGRGWTSGLLPGSIAPNEVALALKKRATPGSGNKWTGATIEIYMPMHQKHPGLAEHAIVGGIKLGSGEVLCFISDRPDPIAAPLWHVFSLYPNRRCAKALLSVIDREGQKDFRLTLPGQELTLRDFAGKKLTDGEIADSLAGVKKYVWCTQLPEGMLSIPANARRFKLGEEISVQEGKSMPAEALIEALDAMMAKRK